MLDLSQLPANALQAITEEELNRSSELFNVVKRLRLKLTNITDDILDHSYEKHVQVFRSPMTLFLLMFYPCRESYLNWRRSYQLSRAPAPVRQRWSWHAMGCAMPPCSRSSFSVKAYLPPWGMPSHSSEECTPHTSLTCKSWGRHSLRRWQRKTRESLCI